MIFSIVLICLSVFVSTPAVHLFSVCKVWILHMLWPFSRLNSRILNVLCTPHAPKFMCVFSKLQRKAHFERRIKWCICIDGKTCNHVSSLILLCVLLTYFYFNTWVILCVFSPPLCPENHDYFSHPYNLLSHSNARYAPPSLSPSSPLTRICPCFSSLAGLSALLVTPLALTNAEVARPLCEAIWMMCYSNSVYRERFGDLGACEGELGRGVHRL